MKAEITIVKLREIFKDTDLFNRSTSDQFRTIFNEIFTKLEKENRLTPKDLEKELENELKRWKRYQKFMKGKIHENIRNDY